MIAPSLPANEAERLRILRELLILDTPPEDRFDIITAFARNRFHVPIVLISLVDENRQWFKSTCGLDVSETSRDISFCAHAILKDEVMVIEDARLDKRFEDNPLVVGEPFIRFYAGCPLKLTSGYNVGTLCLIDRIRHPFQVEDTRDLKTMAKLVVAELEK